MKHFTILLCIFLTHATIAQNNKVTQSLEKFAEVKGFDGISINLIRSSENKAVISGENTDNVVIVNNDGILKIRMQITKFFSGYKTFVDLYYTDDIMVIDVNEDARISSDATIIQDILELKSQEGGEVDVTTEVEQLLVKSVTGGIVKTSGVANLQDVQINTGGIYEGKALKTKFSTVNVNAGSRAEIYASDYVKAAVKAGGEVLVYGNPPKLEEKTVFGGRIIRM